ncbi:hypothetical protein DEJ16_03195 [Curtobacterium sp. MCJR17_055]|uniref:hypothetical protein n=1 Tax=unclassified Curtobacterium TaxID=257496 RepID=UPI000D8DBF88|nr:MULTISPECIES: hypothetical protein [unclassified Curtobacterium]PYY33843.1 hypothetical protein DEI87_11365 [Curtobacterium sp. MCBD17_029]PYY58686.1 hypothetical protein DEJ16_03195 [Curtobacterium sp. MCJR17_055]PYY59772.1 hypothetical protein DEJ26_07710 [Curtobacterium sp. MCPF17_015]WIB36441.1 hypothetical protein DEJ15_04685 [Curtobacterium sp. MCJR17_043]
MTTTPRSSSRPLFAGLLALGLVTGLSACTGAPSSAAGTADADAGLGSRWGACMRSAGFSVEDPSDDQIRSGTITSPSGVDQDRFRSAADQCAEDLGVHGADSASKEKWIREYDQVASCIRDAYPDFPEQRPGVIEWDREEYPPAGDPAFQQRADECTRKYSPDTKTQSVG